MDECGQLADRRNLCVLEVGTTDFLLETESVHVASTGRGNQHSRPPITMIGNFKMRPSDSSWHSLE